MTRINMTRSNMTRSNALRHIAGPRDFVAWGKQIWTKQISNVNVRGNINALVFAAVLIACSLAVGCSKDQPKTVTANNQIPVMPPAPVAATPTPIVKADNQPAPKKVVRKKPATVNYTDKTYGVAFEYPRRYAIETGEAATELLTSSPVPMNFVQPGGIALAAVELPETGYTNTDFSSAFFDVSVHKGLTADQCSQFAVPAPAVSEPPEVSQPQAQPVLSASSSETAKSQAAPIESASSEASPAQPAAAANPSIEAPASAEATHQTASSAEVKSAPETSAPADGDHSTTASSQPGVDSKLEPKSDSKSDSNSGAKTDSPAPVVASEAQVAKPAAKPTLSDLEMHGTEAVSGEGTRQSDSKYFHVYQNGGCYEFVMNVTTNASGDGITKHVDRDRVFANLEKILATVQFDQAKAGPEAPETADAPKAPATPEGHMQ